VPSNKRENKVRVKKFLHPENLVGRPDWNTKTTGAMEVYSKRSRVNSEFDRSNMYRYNYRAEVLPPKQPVHVNKSHRFKTETMSEAQKADILAEKASDPVLSGKAKRTEEMPVNPKLQDKIRWAQSTVPLAHELRSNLNRIMEGSKKNSKNKNAKLKNYVSVVEREAMKRERLREIKKSGADMSKFIMTGKLEDEPLFPTHNRLAKETSQKYRVYSHSGKWEYNEAEGRDMWSDTGSFTKESPGDIVRVINKAGYNFASPTVPRGENLGFTKFDIASTKGL
jgi:hypothetical protein